MVMSPETENGQAVLSTLNKLYRHFAKKNLKVNISLNTGGPDGLITMNKALVGFKPLEVV